MVAIILTILLILLIGGVAYGLWKKAPDTLVPPPFKEVGSWLILVGTIVLVVFQIIKLIHLVG